jgi:hypothetical protein
LNEDNLPKWLLQAPLRTPLGGHSAMAGRKRGPCNVSGCAEREYKGGVCKTHAAENYVVGCSAKNCPKEVFSKGLCRTHYMRKWRRRKGQSAPSAEEPVRDWRRERYAVFTRIPREYADILLREAGRPKGMYELVKKILVEYAKRKKKDSDKQ